LKYCLILPYQKRVTASPKNEVLTCKTGGLNIFDDSLEVISGAISIEDIKGDMIIQEPVRKISASDKEPSINIFPNPARGGSMVRIGVDETKGWPKEILVYTSGGQLILRTGQEPEAYSTVLHLLLPQDIRPGLYVVQVLYSSKKSATAKLVVE
jgi:hypothetical protein